MSQARTDLINRVRAAIAPLDTEETILRAAVELIDAYSPEFNWTGFYMLRDGALEVGPFIGPETEHTRIELNAGICGAAASQKQSVIVDDVTADPDFLACSLTTKSEIVVPLMDGETVMGEIDIDSDRHGNFDDNDRQMLEEIAAILVERLLAIR